MSKTQLPGKYLMRFIKAKGGPSTFTDGRGKTYIQGEVIKLPLRYADFAYFEILDERQDIILPDEDEIFQVEEGFDLGLGEDLKFEDDKGAFHNPDLEKPKSELDDKLESFNKMTKVQLVSYIMQRDGEVKSAWNKERLIEEAINASSPTLS